MHIQSVNKNSLINFNNNYRKEMKLVLVNMHCCLLQFDALIFFLEVHLHGGHLPNFIFIFQCKPLKFGNEIVMFTSQIVWIQISDISLRVTKLKNYN